MTLYDVLIELSKKSYNKIYINLCNKTLKVGRKELIKQGNVLQHKINVGDDTYEFDDLIKEPLDLNELYSQYKYSVPSERENRRHYFKALSMEQLTDAQLVYGMPRLEARVRLEAYILLASLSGLITWNNTSHWYWQGQDRDFVILKQFVL